jgi:diguanylate cyclase (GGDEF)-like protein
MTLRRQPDQGVLDERLAQANQGRVALHALVDRAFLAFLDTLLAQSARETPDEPMVRLLERFLERRLTQWRTQAAATRAPAPASGAISPDQRSLEDHVASLFWATSQLPVAPNSTDRGTPAAPHAHIPRIDLKSPRADAAQLQEALEMELKETALHQADLIAQIVTAHTTLVGDGIEARAAGQGCPGGGFGTENPSELPALREILLESSHELRQGHEQVSARLQGLSQRLHELKAAHARLQEITDAALRAAITDASTGLPNRAGFRQRLRIEIERAQRYRHPLTLAVIAPDRLVHMDHLYGTPAGEAIARCYADQILTGCRASDVVGRSNPYEFAWLLPETEKDQAVSALHQAQQRATGSRYRYKGRDWPAPAFFSGLTDFLPGDTPESLLDRASQACGRGRQTGSHGVVVESQDTVAMENL